MYCWGSGRIGSGSLSNVLEPSSLSFNDTTSNTTTLNSRVNNQPLSFISISSGKSHSLLIDEKNRVWMFGDGSVGQGGNGVVETVYPYPTLIRDLDQIYDSQRRRFVKVVCWVISFALTDTGDLYSWGPTSLIGYPLNTGELVVPIPTKIPLSFPVSTVACSQNHCVLVSKDGRAYSWGKSDMGRLGLGKELSESIDIPTLVESLNNTPISMVSCGLDHTLFLDSNGLIHSCGSGQSTGIELHDNIIYKPSQIMTLNEIIMISSGDYHNIVMDREGRVFVFGENLYGQFGNGTVDDGSYLPSMVPGIEHIKAVSVEAGSGHNAVVSDTGALYMFGGALVENPNPKFRMNVALGGGQGGFSTAQFPVQQNQVTKVSENIELQSFTFLQNIPSISQSTDSTSSSEEDERFLLDSLLAEQDYLAEARDNLTPLLIPLSDPVQLISCGQFHTISFNSSKRKNIESLITMCINNICNNTDTNLLEQVCELIPHELVWRIDNQLTITRHHTEQTSKLFSELTRQQMIASSEHKQMQGDISNAMSWNSYLELFKSRYEFDHSFIYHVDDHQVVAHDMDCDIDHIQSLFNNNEHINNCNINNLNINNQNNTHSKKTTIKINQLDYIIVKNDQNYIISMINNKNICMISKTKTLIVVCTASISPPIAIKSFDEIIKYFMSCGY